MNFRFVCVCVCLGGWMSIKLPALLCVYTYVCLGVVSESSIRWMGVYLVECGV